MRVHCFRATNFRNIEEQTIPFSPGVNLILGENAQGKTNALEGIYTFARGKSFRGGKDAELVRFGAQGYRIALEYESKEIREELSQSYFGGQKKRFRRGIELEKQTELLGHFRAVLFCPEHLTMIKEGPGERRQFLNIAISQCFPAYLGTYAAYQHCLTQRNALLRSAAGGERVDGEELEVFTAAVAKYASLIYAYRRDYVKRLKEPAGDIHASLSSGREQLKMHLITDLSSKEELSQKEAEEKYLALLHRELPKELQTGSTRIGSHRDDLGLFINGKSARDYASQGQQRTAVLSLKLAEGAVCSDIVGEEPVYLFDDVLSELDEGRRRVVIEGSELSYRQRERQFIITACESSDFCANAHIIQAKAGTYVSSHR